MDRLEIKACMAEILNQPANKLQDDLLLADLVTESFVLIDMVIELQDKLDILLVQDDLKNVKTVGDLLNVMLDHRPRTGLEV